MKDAPTQINRGTMGAMKKWRWDALALVSIAIIIIAFFWKFFLPLPQLLVTPDFGRSDAWHFSFPTKYLLSQSLKAHSLPIWSAKLGTGFPLLAEGQTGTFFLPNLLLYKFLSPVTAYNISFILVAVTIGWGTYVFLRMRTCSRLASWFGGVTFAFSGLVQTQLPHMTLLQGFSLLPWVLVATDYLAKKKSFTATCILAALISQQLFAGFPQAVVLTILFAGSYYAWQTKLHIGDIARFALAILLALGLSAVQLFPSIEFLQNSSARGGFSPQDAAYFSYPLKHLVTFLDPFRLGNPKFGTYPDFSRFNGSIFWENTGFIGIVPLIAAVVFFSSSRFFLISITISFLLMLGSNGPLYIVYSMWPLNLFRVPSRFLWIFVFCLIILAANGIDRILKKISHSFFLKALCVAFLILNIWVLMKEWRTYQATAPATSWMSPPESIKLLSADRIYTIGSEATHNETFLTKGWQDMHPYYALREVLAPDSNIFWNISSLQVYAGRFLRRQALVDSLLRSSIQTDVSYATVSAQSKKVLNVFGVGQLVSTVPVDAPELSEIGSAEHIHVYANPKSTGRTYLTHQLTVVQTLEEAVHKIQENSFVPGKSVLIEQPVEIPDGRDGGQTEITKETDTTVTIAVRANAAVSLLVLADTYYPGWRAFVDGAETQIFAVNINERGVVVNPGNHTVRFVYDPQSLHNGFLISAIALFIIAAGFLLSFLPVHTHPKISGQKRHSSRSHGTSRPHRG